jgi:hypothetical protein
MVLHEVFKTEGFDMNLWLNRSTDNEIEFCSHVNI